MTKIAVIDYGMGNLRSVEKALLHVGAEVEVTNQRSSIEAAEGVVLPGVGAFPAAIKRIRELELDALLAQRLSEGIPTLGICLGLQLLFEASSEHEGAWGLGLLQGRVEQLKTGGLKVPHIGWNRVEWQKPSRLSDGIESGSPFYFVHSFAPRVVDQTDTLGRSEYGSSFTCAVERGPLFGIQFHPEKSSKDGLRLLANFVRICEQD